MTLTVTFLGIAFVAFVATLTVAVMLTAGRESDAEEAAMREDA